VRSALSRAAAVVTLWDGAAATLRDYLGVPGERIHVIPNGVQASRFTPATERERAVARAHFLLDAERFTVVYVGALAPEKGVGRIVRAAAELRDLQFLIVGDGPQRALLENSVDDRGCPVTFVGSIADARDAYRAADALVLPSRGGDSMPAVIIEAGLCGLPCVASDIEAIPEIILDGITGRIVDRDEEHGWAEHLERVATDPLGARAMGVAARSRCLERFDIDVVAQAWVTTIDSV
jgi:phosphatidylinositol alpha-mannosyltransferase